MAYGITGDDEDFEFKLETSTGWRQIVMSKTNVARIGGHASGDAAKTVELNDETIKAIVERKIAKGRCLEGTIFINGTDL